jgi:hypothetical protein
MKTLSMLKSRERFFERDFYVFDLETTPFKLDNTCEFIFGAIYGFEFTKVINNKEEFIIELKDKRYLKKKVFAHNAEFDLTVLYGNIYNIDSEAIFNGKFIAATNGVCMFADSMNIFSTSVKEVGKMMKLEKQELSKEFWNKSEVTQSDIDYCIRDCEIVYKALLSIFNLVGNVKITLAGLSLDLFRRKYQKFHIDYNDEIGNLFFNSYYGGRCEAFYIGETSAVVYDKNSMYPNAMNEVFFPNPKYLQKKSFVPRGTFLNKYLPNFEGCAYVTIKHLNTTFGFLPHRRDGKLLFPVGNFTGWWNFNEIRFAVEQNAIEIIEVHEIVFAVRMESPFKEFVQDCYKNRFTSEQEFIAYLWKIIMNALYGKFAQKIDTEFIYIKDMEKEYAVIKEIESSGKFIKMQLFNELRNDCFLEVSASSKSYLYNTIPLFSSYITSYARVDLLKDLIKNEKFIPLYCDTDSIFYEIDPEIESSKELGKWKKENKLVTEINGLKNYSYIYANEIKTKIKGVPGFTLNDNNERIKVEKDSKGIYKYRSLLKTKEALRRNLEPGTFIMREKVMRGKYDKRIVDKDGRTRPVEL